MPEGSYFLRRLSTVRQNTTLPASVQFDLARSPLDDDELDAAIASFNPGGQFLPAGMEGTVGFTDVLEDMMNRQPRMLAVTSLQDYQGRLLEGGYLPPNYPVTGLWDYQTAGASRRMERDALSSLGQGRNFLTASSGKFFQALSYHIPTEIVRSLAAQIEALPEQIVETAGHGFVTGATTGAAAGAALTSWSGPGAVVGGILGGLFGMGMELFGKDEDDENQNSLSSMLDALLPNEWVGQGGSKVALQDFGTILTFATAAGAVGRTGAAFLETKAAVSGASLGQKLAMGFGDDLAKGIQPGVFGKYIAKFTPTEAGKLWMQKASVYTRANPLLKGSRSMYAGWSQNSMIAHIAGGMGGEKDPVDPRTPWYAEALGGEAKLADKKGSPLAEALEDAPTFSTFEMPVVGGDFIDWTVGTVMWPDKLLPGNYKEVGRTIDQWGTDAHLTPLYDAFLTVETAKGRRLTRRQVRDEVDNLLGTDPIDRADKLQQLAFSFGVDKEVSLLMARQAGWTRPPSTLQQSVLQRAGQEASRNRAVQKVTERLEVEAAGGKSDFMRQVMTHFADDTAGYVAYLESIDLPNINNFFENSRVLAEAERAGLVIPGVTRSMPFETSLRYKMARDKTAAADHYRTVAREAPNGSPEEAEALATARKLETEAERLKEQGKKLTETRRTELKDVRQNPAFETTNTVLLKPETWLREEIMGNTKTGEVGVRDILIQKTDDLRKAAKVAKDTGDNTAYVNLFEEYEALLKELSRREVIAPDELPAILEAIKNDAKHIPVGRITARLKEMARGAPRRPEMLDPALASQLEAAGWKVGVRSGRVIRPQDLRTALGKHATEVGEYATKHKAYDFLRSTILPGGLRQDKGGIAIAQMKNNATAQALDSVLEGIEEIPFNGKTATHEIASFMEGMREGKKYPIYRPDDKLLPRAVKRELRSASPTDIVKALRLDHYVPGKEYQVANKILKGIHLGQSLGADFHLNPYRMLQVTGHALSLQGLPGFADTMRTMHLPVPKRFADKNHYGYLANELWQVNMLGRYGLNLLFDLSRRVEQKMMGKFYGDLPLFRMMHVDRYMKKQARLMGDDWVTPFVDDMAPLNPDNLNIHMNRLYDEVIVNRPMMSVLEEIEGRSDLVGMSMFNPKKWEAAQGWLIYQKMAAKHGEDVYSWSKAAREELTEKVLHLQQYGSRTGLERSAHMVMFPLSFQRKLYRGMGDWVLSAPYRNMLLQEGLRRFQSLNDAEGDNSFMEKYVPIGQLLGQLNNFQYGLSPGRFLGEGLFEENREGIPRSTLSKAVEAATAFFVPGGSATPLHQAAGEATEALKWLFVPTVLDEDGTRKFLSAIDRVFPAIDDLTGTLTNRGLAQQIPGQFAAMFGNGSPEWQFRNYDAHLDFYNQYFNQMAADLGYSTAQGLFNSVNGAPFKAQYDELVNALGTEFPQGQQFASTIVDETRMNRRIIDNLIKLDERTAAQDTILSMWEINELAKAVAAKAGVRQDLVQAAISPVMRKQALENQTDREFASLWDKFLAEEYGPIQFPG